MNKTQCLCGCGNLAPFTRGTQKRYVHGHNKSTLGKILGPHSQEWKSKVSSKLKGIKKPIGFGKKNDQNPIWKGEKVGYTALHVWVRKNLGKPKKCSVCNDKNTLTKDGRSRIQYANIDGSYKRVLSHYLPMCPSCHKKHDLNLKKYAK